MLAAIHDIAWEAAQGKMGAAEQEQEDSCREQECAEDDQKLSKICHSADAVRRIAWIQRNAKTRLRAGGSGSSFAMKST